MNEENKNLYLIKRQLAALEPRYEKFCYYVGDFLVTISTDVRDLRDRITYHDKVNVSLSEKGKSGYDYVGLETDHRFRYYAPIKYSDIQGYSYGDKMPIMHLCELVKYLHRLSNLQVFA